MRIAVLRFFCAYMGRRAPRGVSQKDRLRQTHNFNCDQNPRLRQKTLAISIRTRGSAEGCKVNRLRPMQVSGVSSQVSESKPQGEARVSWR